jgi:hypothetical protein
MTTDTWGEVPDNYVENIFRTRVQPGNVRPVRIVETGEVFESLAQCARWIGGSSMTISRCLSGKRKTHLGFTFEYIIPTEEVKE